MPHYHFHIIISTFITLSTRARACAASHPTPPTPSSSPPGLAGALGFWPATVLFPIECWLVVFRPRRSVRHALRALSVVCAIISLLCIVASVQQIVAASGTFELFGSSDVQVDNTTA